MRRAAVLALLCGALAVAAGPSAADPPERTAWYTALTVGPVTAPAPTVAADDLQVAGTGERPTAYAALALTDPGGAGGELVLAVRATAGTPELAACPTRASDWKAGGGQPFSAGPEYDCARAEVLGSVSADGRSVVFLLDQSLRAADGTLSLALAPLPASTSPFSIDLGDPVFTPAPADGPDSPATDGGAGAPPADPPGSDVGSPPADPPSGDLAEPAAAPGPDQAFGDPATDLGAGPGTMPDMGLAAGVEAGAGTDPGTDPAVAPPASDAAPPAAVLPGATLAAGRTDTPAGPRLLALLALVAVSAGTGYAVGQQRPAPRLLGGRARALPAGGPAGTLPVGGPAGSLPRGSAPGALGGTAPPPGAVAVREPAGSAPPRGIGRFSRVRDNPPRRLR